MTEEAKHTPTLLPCPFCGTAPILRETIEHYQADSDGPAGNFSCRISICCDTCGIEQSEEYHDDAVSLWNRRAQVDELLVEAFSAATAHGKTKLELNRSTCLVVAQSAELTTLRTKLAEAERAALRVLEWVGPIAGDNRDEAASREETESVDALRSLFSQAQDPS